MPEREGHAVVGEPSEHQTVRLAANGWTEVLRVIDTVRRPAWPFMATSTRSSGTSTAGGSRARHYPSGVTPTAVKSSPTPGGVPVEPLPASAATDNQLADLARLIRRLHDAAEGWVPLPDAVFGTLPGVPPPGVEPLFTKPEVVSHQDYCPGNVVFHDGRPAGLIDFDLARPTTRVAENAEVLRKALQ